MACRGVAAAVIEKRRSYERDIVAAANAEQERDAPNSLIKSDLEQSIAFQKEGPITDAKSAAKARKKAIKAKLKAEQAEASAAEARERLNKGAEMDTMIMIAKSVVAGEPSAFTKRDFFLELQKRADENRRPGEKREQAFARYATADPDGQVLMQAHKAASGEDYSGEPGKTDDEPVTNEAFRQLMDLAIEKKKDVRPSNRLSPAYMLIQNIPSCPQKNACTVPEWPRLWEPAEKRWGRATVAISPWPEVWAVRREGGTGSRRRRFSKLLAVIPHAACDRVSARTQGSARLFEAHICCISLSFHTIFM
jgi:hypothetical protein